MTSGDSPSPLELCRSYLEAFRSRDVDAIAAHVADDFVNEHASALGSGCVGRGEYQRRLRGFLGAMPDLRYSIDDTVADGDKVVIAYTLHARVNGRDISVPGVMRFVVRESRIAWRMDYWDSLVFQRQAGLV